MAWISEAKWPDTQVRLNSISTDRHETEEHALTVTQMLERDGFGGEGKIFPIETRVYNEEDE